MLTLIAALVGIAIGAIATAVWLRSSSSSAIRRSEEERRRTVADADRVERNIFFVAAVV